MTVPTILLVEDDLALREALAETLGLANYEVRVAADGKAALRVLADSPVTAVVSDYQMQPMDGYELLKHIRERYAQLPVLLMTAYGSIEHAVDSMMQGATDYLVKPFSAQLLIDKLAGLIPPRLSEDHLIAEDPRSLEVLELARRVAPGETTVLLTGESGSGKEVFARYLHRHSDRADGPFVAINCAAIPENMLEAVLFGHEKGAFTGAHEARPGKFELAQGGTLLLDEISEMDLALQAKLLRVLQEREVERIGARRSVPLDVRVLATTNRDLAGQVRAGKFREDLYYRLSVFPLQLPPLRERQADILPLARHFLAAACKDHRPVPGLGDDAAAELLRQQWPGNVRELQNTLQRALILCNGNRVRARDLRLDTALQPAAAETPDTDDTGLQRNLKSLEGQLIIDALEQGGSRKKAAELLGISPRTLRYKIARLREAGIALPERRGAAA